MKKDLENLTDAELLACYEQGDEEAFRTLLTRYKEKLYAFLRRFLIQQDLVEDVFQETFLQVYNSRDRYDTSRSFRPWLFTIAANKAKDALRKQQRTAAKTLGTMPTDEEMSISDVLNIITSVETTPFDEAVRGETSATVRKIISEMPENLHEILLLAYFNRFSYKQMSQVLSIPIGTVKSRLHVAVVNFAKRYKTLRQE